MGMAPRSAYHLLAKPAGAACNLGCRYCFFLSKENLYPARESPLMPDDLLDTYIRQLMDTSFGPEIEVAWQGGEPMLRGLDFFRRSVALAEKYRPKDMRVRHTIQTNGTLIDDAWARFFKAERLSGRRQRRRAARDARSLAHRQAGQGQLRRRDPRLDDPARSTRSTPTSSAPSTPPTPTIRSTSTASSATS